MYSRNVQCSKVGPFWAWRWVHCVSAGAGLWLEGHQSHPMHPSTSSHPCEVGKGGSTMEEKMDRLLKVKGDKTLTNNKVDKTKKIPGYGHCYLPFVTSFGSKHDGEIQPHIQGAGLRCQSQCLGIFCSISTEMIGTWTPDIYQHDKIYLKWYDS